MSGKITRFTAVMYDDEIKQLDEIDSNRAAATRQCVDRYFFIVENATPSLKTKLTEEQIEAVADHFNNFGFFKNDLPLVPKHFHELIRMVLETRGSDLPDVDALIETLRLLPIDEKFALMHEAEKRQRDEVR